MYKKLDYSIDLFKFFRYQKIQFDKNLFDVLEIFINDKKKFNKLDNIQKSHITDDIKNMAELFGHICARHNMNYLNYIIIFESISNDYLKNFFRFFSYKWYKLINSNETLKCKKENLKLKYKYIDIYKSSEPKKLIIENLLELSKKIKIIPIYFLGCLNEFII